MHKQANYKPPKRKDISEGMAIETQKFIRKPLYVDAVRLSSNNFDEIADWCQGEILQGEVGTDTGEWAGKPYIKVRVHNPKNPRQTKAFVGDWLLYTERGYKVYTNKAFHASFDEVSAEEAQLSHPELTGDPVRDAAEHTVNEYGEVQTPDTGVVRQP